MPSWLPSWLPGAAILAAAAAVALLAHWVSLRIVLQVPVPGRARGFLQTFVATTTGPSRLALVVLALWAALPSTGLAATVSRGIGQALLVGLIVLVGWSAMRANEIAAALYLRRFRLDVDDNLLARKHVTQMHFVKRAGDVLIAVFTMAAALMTFASVRAYGLSLLASAGAASLLVGLAARPLLTNLIAGVQIAVTQPIRLEDAVIVEGEWGWVEEITSTYVVVRLWDWRRMILPLSYFLEKPFQNWTRETSSLIGSVFLYVDYSVPVEAVRRELAQIARASPLWDGRVVNLQVSDAKEWAVELRALVSARNAPQAWDLRCEVREKLVAFLQREYPHALPTARVQLHAQAAGPERHAGGRTEVATGPSAHRAGAVVRHHP
ncbi:MAG TPA: mechanosensitive ion channel domain-containing protein [Acetobacteraceae bacterium]|nr:mechanosensitive ion channel domain-containing protein [Acetobacteraceae bacterium]